jgi:hypothetical protein
VVHGLERERVLDFLQFLEREENAPGMFAVDFMDRERELLLVMH